MSPPGDGRRTPSMFAAAVVGALVLGVLAVVTGSIWAGVGALVLLTPVLLVLLVRGIGRL